MSEEICIEENSKGWNSDYIALEAEFKPRCSNKFCTANLLLSFNSKANSGFTYCFKVT